MRIDTIQRFLEVRSCVSTAEVQHAHVRYSEFCDEMAFEI